MSEAKLKAVVVGLGYFSQFHLTAWKASNRAELVGICDTDEDRLAEVALELGVTGKTNLSDLIQQVSPDIIDIVAPPPAHADIIRTSLAPGRTIICQKPFCTSIAEAESMIAEAEAAGSCIVIHENFRFQPWHREVRDFLASGQMGTVYQARFDLRPGDGRGPDAYLARQPAFQQMPRFLFHETGVHIIDVFRSFFGDISALYAESRQLNPAISGEDAGHVVLHHTSGVRAVFDGNRLSDHVSDNPRRTMGEMVIEGDGGTLYLNGAGALSFRPFGAQASKPVPIRRSVDDTTFGGGCVGALIDDALEALSDGRRPENTADEYLHVMKAVEAAYRSAETGARVSLGEGT